MQITTQPCPSLHDVVQQVCHSAIYSLKYPLTIGAVSRKEAVYRACVCCQRRVIEGVDGDMVCAEYGTVLPELCYRVRVKLFERATGTELWVCFFDNMMKRFVATEPWEFEKTGPVEQTAVLIELVGKQFQVTLGKKSDVVVTSTLTSKLPISASEMCLSVHSKNMLTPSSYSAKTRPRYEQILCATTG